MNSPNPIDDRPAGPSAWLFAPQGAGDMHQLRSLAGLIDARVRVIERFDPVPRVLIDRIASTVRLPSGLPADLQPPWPELALVAGGRSVIDARRLARDSGGRTRVVCIGRPWAPLHWFDLILSTPQYGLPQTDNLLQLELPLNLPSTPVPAELEHWRAAFEELPRPLLGVLLGGDSGSYRFTERSAERIAREIDRELRRCGGSAVVVASPRTPPAAFGRLRQVLEMPASWHPWQAGASGPYRSLLHLADALAVTGDSASMLAEACFSARPTALLQLEPRAHTRALSALRRATPGLDRLRDGLTRRGLWLPARDMSRLHQALYRRGWLRPLAGIAQPGVARAEVLPQIIEPVRHRVLELLEHRESIR